MIRVLIIAAFTVLALARPVSAQLPMGIPDLCAGSPDTVLAGRKSVV